MYLLYTSLKPWGFCPSGDCHLTSYINAVIFKNQERSKCSESLIVSSYRCYLPDDFYKLESQNDSSSNQSFINFTANQLITIKDNQVNYYQAEDRTDLLQYLISNWGKEKYTFIDCKYCILEFSYFETELDEIKAKIENLIEQEANQIIEGQKEYEDDCYDYYDSIKHGCLN